MIGSTEEGGSGRTAHTGPCRGPQPRLSPFWHAFFPAALFGILVVIFETTDLDLRLSDLFFDFNRGRFFWRDAWWANGLLHTGGRLAIVGVAAVSALLLLLSFLRRCGAKLRNAQRAALFLLLSLAVGPGTAAALKLVVHRPYPEHIQRYGGAMPYTRLFQGGPAGARKYAGFPAAHSSSGYALVALYFVFRARRKGLAAAGLALALTAGTLFAFAQQVRGMHYASHNIWSAAICWYGCLALYVGPFRRVAYGPLFHGARILRAVPGRECAISLGR